MSSPCQSLTPPDFVRLAAHPLRWRLLSELAESDRHVGELVTRVDEPQNLVSYHLRLLRDGGLVTATRSSFDGRQSFYHLDLDRCGDALAASGAALHPALRRPALRREAAQPTARVERPRGRRPSVLFVCTGNGARSPIAEALLRHRSGGGVTVTSAGSQPRRELHPDAVRVLREDFDIDISGRRPRHLKTLAIRRFDQVITLCDKAREVCPEFPHHPRRVHWSIREPTGYADFQRTASDIDTRIRHLLPTLGSTVTDRQEVPP